MKKKDNATNNNPPDDNEAPRVESTSLSQEEISKSLAEYLEREREMDPGAGGDNDVDIGSILEEINKIAAQSPMGPFENGGGDRSVDDIMKEVAQVYNESYRSFEQLSQRSQTSQNVSPLDSEKSESTPTPKSLSSLPTDSENRAPEDKENTNSDDYIDDFSDDNKSDDICMHTGRDSITDRRIQSGTLQNGHKTVESERVEDVHSHREDVHSDNVADADDAYFHADLNKNFKALDTTPETPDDVNLHGFVGDDQKSDGAVRDIAEYHDTCTNENLIKSGTISGVAVSVCDQVRENESAEVQVTLEDVEVLKENLKEKENLMEILMKDNECLKEYVKELQVSSVCQLVCLNCNEIKKLSQCFLNKLFIIVVLNTKLK